MQKILKTILFALITVLIPSTVLANSYVDGVSPDRFKEKNITYYVSPRFSNKQKLQINQAINTWNQPKIIQLIPGTKHQAKVIIMPSDQTQTTIKVNGGHQITESDINLKPKAKDFNLAVKNEIANAIGMNLNPTKTMKLSQHELNVLLQMY